MFGTSDRPERRSVRPAARWLILLAVLGAVAARIGVLAEEPAEAPAADAKSAGEFSAEQIRFFEKQVEPLLAQHCRKCHGGEKKIRGNLRLTSRADVLRGGDTGPAAKPGQPAVSLLIKAIHYDGYEMPPSGKLPAEQIAVLTRWVEMGLPWTPGKPGEPAPAAKPDGPPQVNAETRKFWSFQPVRRPPVPAVGGDESKQNPIDAFLQAKRKEAGLVANPPADRVTWIRRATYDLIGLPPTRAEVEAFLADDSPQSYERVVDRLLDSPHYGEKWARQWLDLVRYAETNSYERDGDKPQVWRYRDYVIDAFNSDKPYDQFIIEQLAGDELEEVSREALIATGYYRLGIWDDEPSDPKLALYDDLDDIVATTSQVFLGLTMNCARCHAHKLDPIPHEDYYRFLAFFSGMQRYGVRSFETVKRQSLRPLAAPEEVKKHAAEVARHQQAIRENQQKLKAIEAKVRGDFIPVEQEEFKHERNQVALVGKRVPKLISEAEFVEYQRLFEERTQLRNNPPAALEMALCVTEIGRKPRPTHVLIRGNPHVEGDAVQPGFPQILGGTEPDIPPAPEGHESSGRRRVLARWIASAENPLTARVLVNRLWQFHFGEGLVRTPSNFGLQGERPTHPELLDWLAAEFVDGGWRIKRMHRLMMLSQAYRMSSTATEESLQADADNRWLSRFNMRRLSAEEIRDSMLWASGAINLEKRGGPSIYPIIPQEVLAGQSRPGAGWGNSSPEDRARRSIYIFIKRSLTVPILASFDVPETDFSCPSRFATTQPTQALGLLNGDFVNRQAAAFAADLQKQSPTEVAAQVREALWRVTQREPSDEETARGVKMIARMQQEHGASAEAALKTFCLLALNLNEFLYLD